MEFVESIKSGHQNDEVAGAGCSEERNPGDWTLLAPSNVENLGKLFKIFFRNCLDLKDFAKRKGGAHTPRKNEA